jgi:large subunit ribosomal protein L5
VARLQEQYRKEILPALQKALNQKNPMAVPKIEKITINMGLGSALGDKKILQSALEEMSLIAGQKPMTCMTIESPFDLKNLSLLPSLSLRSPTLSAFFVFAL